MACLAAWALMCRGYWFGSLDGPHPNESRGHKLLVASYPWHRPYTRGYGHVYGQVPPEVESIDHFCHRRRQALEWVVAEREEAQLSEVVYLVWY